MSSSQRPFFANFMAAFRAQSVIQQQTAKGSSTSPSGVSPSSQQAHTTTPSASTSNTVSNPRTIATKSSNATSSALTQLHSPRSNSTSPLSRSPGPDTPQNPSPGYMRSSNRRGSDSSSDGFRDVLGAEKWYIGGRTATGEERFFKLGVVKRHRSIDRLSLDRLSL